MNRTLMTISILSMIYKKGDKKHTTTGNLIAKILVRPTNRNPRGRKPMSPKIECQQAGKSMFILSYLGFILEEGY